VCLYLLYFSVYSFTCSNDCETFADTSPHRFPSKLRSMCHCLFQVVNQRFQQSTGEAVWTVIGTVIFLRFINPAIGKSCSVCSFGVVTLGVVLLVNTDVSWSLAGMQAVLTDSK